MSLIPAVEVDEEQYSEGDATNPRGGSVDRNKTVVIAFVGGVTQSELAGLRKVAASDESKFPHTLTTPHLIGQVNFIFATTGVLTWKDFIKSLFNPIPVASAEN